MNDIPVSYENVPWSYLLFAAVAHRLPKRNFRGPSAANFVFLALSLANLDTESHIRPMICCLCEHLQNYERQYASWFLGQPMLNMLRSCEK